MAGPSVPLEPNPPLTSRRPWYTGAGTDVGWYTRGLAHTWGGVILHWYGQGPSLRARHGRRARGGGDSCGGARGAVAAAACRGHVGGDRSAGRRGVARGLGHGVAGRLAVGSEGREAPPGSRGPCRVD